MAQTAREPESPKRGDKIAGKYELGRLIGQGGMGAVYEATNAHIGKRVALKFLNGDFVHDPEATQRFLREAQAASAIESAHIVQIFDAGSDETRAPFLVMELLQGEDLRARLDREEQLALATVRHLGLQILRALAAAHAAGIVHRDLKPENVYICKRDDDPLFVKLVDFGISKLTHGLSPKTLTGHGTVMGTAAYMSPEQAQAFADIDGRADLYSVGAILFEALSGRPPHVGPTYEAVLINLCTIDAPDVRDFAPQVPEDMARILARALCRDRDDRFPSAESFAAALAAVVCAPDSSSPTTIARTTPHPADPLARSRQLRRRTYRWVVAALLGALGVLTLLAVRSRRASDGEKALETPALVAPEPNPAAAPPEAAAAQPAAPAPRSDDAREATPAASASKPGGDAASTASGAKRGARPKTTPRPSDSPPPSGVAGGLKLDTSGP